MFIADNHQHLRAQNGQRAHITSGGSVVRGHCADTRTPDMCRYLSATSGEPERHPRNAPERTFENRASARDAHARIYVITSLLT